MVITPHECIIVGVTVGCTKAPVSVAEPRCLQCARVAVFVLFLWQISASFRLRVVMCRRARKTPAAIKATVKRVVPAGKCRRGLLRG